MEQWKEYKLGDIASLKYGKLPPKNNSGYYPIWSGYRYVGFADSFNCKKGTIIVVARGVGGTGDVKFATQDCFLTNLSISVEIDYNICNPRYFYYLFQINNLRYLDSGSAQSQITIEDLKRLQIYLPKLHQQNKIVNLLSSLDDKIELNRRINDNLEQQAQALFDDMFFNNIELERYNLSNYADINPFRSIKKNSEARFIEMSNLPTHGSFPLNWDYKHYNGGMKFSNGDTIMARITPCLENGKTAYIDFLDDNEVAFGSTEYIVFSARNGYCPALFYYLARNQEFIDYAISHMNGSSGRQRVSGNDIANFPMPHISKDSSDKFGIIVMPIMSIIQDNSIMNRALAQLRDTLLPRLMSGELRISEIETEKNNG